MRIVEFVEDMKERAVKGLLEVSGVAEYTKVTTPFKNHQAEVRTIRGGAFEKAAITHLTFKGLKPPIGDKQVDYMVFQMEIFPENPFCPMGHFNTEWSLEGPGPYHMNLDLFPAVKVAADLEKMKQRMDGVADQFSLDRDKMREGLDEHYGMEHWDVPLAAKVGCKLLNLTGAEIELFINAYQTFFEGYLNIIATRKNTPYTEEDRKLKLRRNSKWLEYITIKDKAVRLGLDAGIPPQVLIALSFPPSAEF